MDGEAFDRWTERVEHMMSRRRITGLLAALGVGIGLTAAAETEAKKKKKKKNKKKRCKAGRQKCGKTCVDIKNDVTHCCGCGRTCAAPGSCQDGVCVCPGGIFCDSTCVPGGQCCGAGDCAEQICQKAACTAHTCTYSPAEPGASCPGGVCCNGDCIVGGECCAAPDCPVATCQSVACDDNQCVYTPLDNTPCAGGSGLCCAGDCIDPLTDDNHCGNCETVCDTGQTCQAGQCKTPPATCGSGGNCLVFVTSARFTGNLEGLTGADQKCNARAQAAGLPGVYKAWLSDSTGSPSTRFVKSTGPYVLVTGTVIADSWDDLTDDDPNHELAHEINRDEFGNEITRDDQFRFTWTNTKPNGTPSSDPSDRHCQNWTTGLGIPNAGNAGNVNWTNSFWTESTFIFCNNPQRLYCFQQS